PGSLFLIAALLKGAEGSGGVVIALLSISWRIVGLIGTAFFFYFAMPPLYVQGLRFYLVASLIFLFFEVATVTLQKILASTLWRRKDASSHIF
ncbi:MAG: hypothetical protein HY042_11490, partial [Spirochaetia bacterium]|nr:hypothetical protein [Spirochaetia bacterium]